MNPMNHLDQVNYIAQLADLKQALYHNSLLTSALIELLVEKEILAARDIATLSAQLDASFTPQPIDAPFAHQLMDSIRTPPLTDASFTHQPIAHLRTSLPVDAFHTHQPSDP